MHSHAGPEAPEPPPGVVGNERLTAIAGGLLLVLLAVEGATLLALRPLLGVHVFVGVLLIGPLAVKLASTGWRFLRYYARDASYRRKGPPALPLRLLAPVLVAATLAVIASGIVLVLRRPGDPGPWLLLHKASFVLWFAVTTVHVLAYVWRVPGLVVDDVRRRVPGRAARLGLTLVAVAAGVAAALLLLPAAAPWLHGLPGGGEH